MNQLENKKISGLQLSLYIIGGIFILSLIITIITLNLNPTNDNNLNDNNVQQNNGNENTEPSKFDRTIIKLSEPTETCDIDNDLKIEFISNKAHSEDATLYKADIYLKGNNINNLFFDGSNIWSEEYTGIFNVYDVDNYYVLVSSVAKQCDGDYVLIIDKDGNTIKTYADVDFSIEKTVISIVDYDVCTTENSSSKNEEFDLKDLK